MTRKSGVGAGYEIGYGKPPRSGQFEKGRSGNPNGRPRKAPAPAASPFDMVLEKTLTIQRGGKRHDATPEEALRQTLMQKALAGDRGATRKVLKMIQARQRARSASAPASRQVFKLIGFSEPENARDALLLLGVIEQDPGFSTPRLQLLPWATQMALDRLRSRRFSDSDWTLIRNSVLDREQVRWPAPDAHS